MQVASSSPEETERVAALIAPHLRAGDVVALSGDLGAGKTTFVRGACRALGIEAAVTSPTFTIGHRYAGRVDVSHLDLYRFERLTEADWGALEPYLDDAICFVEWAEVAAGWLPPPRLSVGLRHSGGSHRLLDLETAENSLLRAVSGGC